ncbi:MAG: serine/threonine protein kinase [Rubrobacter sp.]|nr:serine/threonine protein kinase [Rubrobacter sp.]
MPPLGQGELLAPDYTVVAPLHRSRILDAYEVWSEERACSCVAKVLRPDCIENRRARASLLREGRILKQLAHPHIVRAYDAFEQPQPIVILESLPGYTLLYLIALHQRRRMALNNIVFLGLHLCSAMHYLHRHGLLHLDLKPSNIVSNLGVAKVLDLNLARPPGRGRRDTGTPAYMAPEQVRGDLFSEATDVWGIGAVLFHAATGRPPFFEPEASRKYQQLERRADSVRAHRRVPAFFATTVDRCLDPDPSQRPTVDELAELLNGLAQRQS